MDADLIRAMKLVKRETDLMDLDLMLVGALVSEFATTENPPYPPRRTNDADFAIRVRGWEQFKALRSSLIRTGMEPDPKIEHRLSLGKAVIDLIPFGPGVTVGDRKIVWPDSKFEMLVIGFEEASASTRAVRIGGSLSIRSVSIPGLVLLKLVAFVDLHSRGDPESKDHAEDIWYWMRFYALGRDDPRRFDTFEWSLPQHDYDTAGAAVLGSDIRRIVAPVSDEQVRRFAGISLDPYGGFASAVVPTGSDDDRRVQVAKTVRVFMAGYDLTLRPE